MRDVWTGSVILGCVFLAWPSIAQAEAHAKIQAKNQYEVVDARIIIENPGGMPALCRASNGDLLLAFCTNWQPIPPVGGSLKLMRSSDDGHTWTTSRVIVPAKKTDTNTATKPHWAKVKWFPPEIPDEWSIHMWSGLHRMPDDSLVLYYGQNYDEDIAEAYVVRSTDNGTTWIAPLRVANKPVQWGDQLVKLPFTEGFGRGTFAANGDFLAPVGVRNRGGFYGWKGSAFIRSKDNGKTWGPVEIINNEPKMKFSETTLGCASNGDLVAVIRCDTARRRFFQSVSHDNGKTWSNPVLARAVNDARPYVHGKMPDMLTLPSGRMLLAVGSAVVSDGGQVREAEPGKSFSRVYFSDDNGETWHPDVFLKSGDPEHLYPYDAPQLVLGRENDILALSVQMDNREWDHPRCGWNQRGASFVLNVLRPTNRSKGN